MVIKAKSPAGFAEKYIIESIWNGRFAPGSILPAERELSELIGVTRLFRQGRLVHSSISKTFNSFFYLGSKFSLFYNKLKYIHVYCTDIQKSTKIILKQNNIIYDELKSGL